jgi:tol-pal system beta propeller repeat protein TolB
MLILLAGLAAPAAYAQRVFFQEVSWSPDGQWLSYTTTQTEAPYTSDILLMKPNGKDRTPVAHGLESARWAAWHPDGTRLAFAGKDGDNWDLYVIELATGQVDQLTSTGASESAPSWSPDGSALVFTDGVDGRSQVFRMNADGTGRINISQSDRRDYNPVWSPNGQRIVFYAAPDTSRDHLWTMRPDGSDQRQLTKGRLRDTFPSWAPDGASIVFTRQQLNTAGIYRMTPDGSIPTEVVDPGFYGRLSPDGTRVAYIRGKWPTSEVWVGGAGDERFKHKRIRH